MALAARLFVRVGRSRSKLALNGDLRDFGLLQVLTLVQLTGKTGCLVLEHLGDAAAIYFENGKLTRVKMPSSRFEGLATALHQAGRIDREQYELISSQAPPSDKAVGLLLTDQGLLSREEIVDFVGEKSVADLYKLMTWPDGTFRLEVGAQLPEEDIGSPADLGPIIQEARGFVEEWQRLSSHIPDLNRPLRLLAEPRRRSESIALGLPEWRMVVSLARDVPLAEVARSLGLSEFEVRQVAFRLIDAGLADVPEPEFVPPAPIQELVEVQQPKAGALSRIFGWR